MELRGFIYTFSSLLKFLVDIERSIINIVYFFKINFSKTMLKNIFITIVSFLTLTSIAQDVNSISWTEVSANAGNTIIPTSGVNYKVTGNSKSSIFNNEYAVKIAGEDADNLWFFSGTVKKDKYSSYSSQSSSGENGDVRGAKYLTVLGNSEDGSDPAITGKFRGAALQEDKDAYVYVYGGTYNDKFSAVSHYTAYNSKVAYNGTVIGTTGHLIISGGSFKSDITGFGMAASGNFTANTDIQIIGKISNGSGMGVFGGISGQSGGSGNLYGNTNITVSGAGQTSFIVAGNRMAADLTGNANASVVDGGTVGAVLGGNYVHDTHANTSSLNGNINILVNNGNVGTISSTGVTGLDMNGIIGGGINTSVSGIVKVDIAGTSTVTGGVTTGSATWGETSINKTQLNISGGTIMATGSTALETATVQNAIYGGSLAIGLAQAESSLLGTTTQYEIYKVSNVTIANGTSINITGGNISGDIFGGGYAQGADSTYTGSMTVNGGSSIVVDAKNDITINNNIYAGGNQGSNGTTITNGGVEVTFKNSDGKNLTFAGTVSGNGLNGAVVNGEKVFNFDSFNGSFNGSIENFDIVNIKSSNLTGSISLSETASNVFVYGESSFDGLLAGMANLTVMEDAIVTVAKSSLLDGINIVNNGQIVFLDIDQATTVVGSVKVDETLSLDVNSDAGVTVNSVTNVKDDFASAVGGDFLKVDAFDFDIDMAESDSVTLSFYVGDDTLSTENFVIYHEKDGVWSEANDVSNVKYEDGVLVFDVSHFSGYGYAATASVPEPAQWAVIFGAVALGFAMYRRRK